MTASAKALFASGCFWGTQYHFDTLEGVIDSRVGYAGGNVANPTYEQVCSGTTGHREAIEVTFDPTKTSYKKLVRFFFETHDFSQTNGQGPDIGTQYTSAIYYYSPEQQDIAESIIEELENMNRSVATEVVPFIHFYPAEEYHQKYYEKNNGAPYCHTYIKLFD